MEEVFLKMEEVLIELIDLLLDKEILLVKLLLKCSSLSKILTSNKWKLNRLSID